MVRNSVHMRELSNGKDIRLVQFEIPIVNIDALKPGPQYLPADNISIYEPLVCVELPHSSEPDI